MRVSISEGTYDDGMVCDSVARRGKNCLGFEV